VEPLIGFALTHAKQTPLHHLEGVGLERGEQEEQPLCRRRKGAVEAKYIIHRDTFKLVVVLSSPLLGIIGGSLSIAISL
jgi:hypothetical protein